MENIYTVTLNPAVDRILYLDEFRPEVTNRLHGSRDGLGGKGTHVSLDLAQLGVANVATGIVHGETGRQILSMLDRDLVEVAYQHYPEQDSRTNYLIIEENGKSTCLSSPGVQLTDEDIASFIAFLREQLQEGDYLVLSGDASNCPDPFVYNRMLEALEEKHLKVFMDASGETLKQCIRLHPYLIKPNQDELSYLAGRELKTIQDITEAAKEIQRYEIPVIAVSLGEEGAVVFVRDEVWRVVSPKVNVRNTIGCGDCFLSGLIYGICNKLSVEETLCTAAAISAACAESELSVGFDKKRAEELKNEVIIQRM